MARRSRRLEPARGHRALVVAATVLLASLVLTGRTFHFGRGGGVPAAGSSSARPAASVQAPYPMGGRLVCPALWPVVAMSDHASYPAGHPARPPAGATPVACYRTTAEAAGAGYAPAPLPAGALEVGGVYLTPTSRQFRAGCRWAADRLGFAVPCPGLLPTGPRGAPPPRLCGEPAACRRGQALRFLQGAFVVPPGYVGAPGGFSVLSVVATPARGAAGTRALRCLAERRITALTVHRVPGVLAACQDDPRSSALGGSVLLRWSERGTAVVVSVLDWSDAGSWSDRSRWSEVNRRLVVALASHVRFAIPGAPVERPVRPAP